MTTAFSSQATLYRTRYLADSQSVGIREAL